MVDLILRFIIHRPRIHQQPCISVDTELNIRILVDIAASSMYTIRGVFSGIENIVFPDDLI